jgi:hypothetical protein
VLLFLSSSDQERSPAEPERRSVQVGAQAGIRKKFGAGGLSPRVVGGRHPLPLRDPRGRRGRRDPAVARWQGLLDTRPRRLYYENDVARLTLFPL